MTNQQNKIAEIISYLRSTNQIATLRGIRRGIEKESLRCQLDGALSQTAHPEVLGSALTHSCITTDYSESLLEFITPAYENLTDVFLYLTDIHHFTYQNLNGELLWSQSMPCCLPDDQEDIPIADYGSSNYGKMKTIYRKGLWHRYGRPMQTIAGIHYNFSLPENFWYSLYQYENSELAFQDFVSNKYFSLIRNFHRYSWLLVYLFGATPAMCKSFLKDGAADELESLDENTLYLPNATSLRMSDIGYQNDAQADLQICYNNLDSYVSSLEAAMRKPHQPYEDIGLKDEQGDYNQLSTNVLQIENEYYGMIRPKRTALRGERPSNALRNRGVEYIEMRLLDIDPFSAVGLETATGYFLELFAVFCLFIDSPEYQKDDHLEVKKNIETAVKDGRNPEATITLSGDERSLKDWATELLTAMEPLADVLDLARLSQNHQQTLQLQKGKVADVSQTPSAKVMEKLRQEQLSFMEFGIKQSQEQKSYFESLQLSEEREQMFMRIAKESLAEQKMLEKNDSLPFDVFLKNWFK